MQPSHSLGLALSIQLTGPTTRPDFFIDAGDHALYASNAEESMRIARSNTRDQPRESTADE